MTGAAGLLLNHLWQSTVVTIAVLLLTFAFRHGRAHVRHGLWCAASMKFLVPFAALRWLGLHVPVAPLTRGTPLLPLTTQVMVGPFSRPEFTAFPQPLESVAVAPSLAPHVPWLLVLLWALGASVVVATWIGGWRALSRLRRCASGAGAREAALLRRAEQRTGMRHPLPVAFIDAPIDPGVFGIRRPVLLWPRCVSDRLTDAQLEAIFAHELSHVRRRDTAVAAAHAGVEAIFWFYPLVWWIGRRMLVEREHACDEDVLRRGSDPGVYAESILRLGECLLEEQRAPAAAATGAGVKTRIERIMMQPRGTSLGRFAQVCLLALGICAVALPVLAGTLLPGGIGYGTVFFQVPRLTTAFAPRAHVDPVEASRARFASAHIRPTAAGERPGIVLPLAGGRLMARAVTVQQLVRYTYMAERVPANAVVAGLPAWARIDRFDVTAFAPHPFVNDENGEPSELVAMLRHLLADRFGLITHEETRELPVYALVRASGTAGPRLRVSTSACWRPPEGPARGVPPDIVHICSTTLQLGAGRFATAGATMRRFASMIAQFPDVDRVVLDETGLDGRFDVSIAWGASSENTSAPDTFFTAMPRQLGLALEPRVAPVDVFVVDHVERPSTD